MTAVIDGVPFNGTATSATNSGGIFGLGAGNAGRTITIGIGAIAAVGTTTIGPLSPTNSLLITSTGQGWSANSAGGSGTLTITSITATQATGTFSFTLVPTSGSGATGNKVMTNGAFSVTF